MRKFYAIHLGGLRCRRQHGSPRQQDGICSHHARSQQAPTSNVSATQNKLAEMFVRRVLTRVGLCGGTAADTCGALWRHCSCHVWGSVAALQLSRVGLCGGTAAVHPRICEVQMFLRIGVYLMRFERYYHTLRKAQTSIDVTTHWCKLPSVQCVCCTFTLVDTLNLTDARITSGKKTYKYCCVVSLLYNCGYEMKIVETSATLKFYFSLCRHSGNLAAGVASVITLVKNWLNVTVFHLQDDETVERLYWQRLRRLGGFLQQRGWRGWAGPARQILFLVLV